MAEKCLSALQWWISSETCFITHLPVWISASKGSSCRTAAEIWLFSPQTHSRTVLYSKLWPCPSKDFSLGPFTLYLQQSGVSFCMTSVLRVNRAGNTFHLKAQPCSGLGYLNKAVCKSCLFFTAPIDPRFCHSLRSAWFWSGLSGSKRMSDWRRICTLNPCLLYFCTHIKLYVSGLHPDAHLKMYH